MSKYVGIFVVLFLVSCASPITTVFNPKKTYVYDAYCINNENDTISKETLQIKTKRIKLTSCGDMRKVKQLYEVDTLALLPDSISKLVRTQDIVNVVEIKDRVLSTPFRRNQYIYTLIAPFPLVRFKALNNGEKWKEYRVFDPEHYDYFIGELESVYTAKGIVNYNYENVQLDSCWNIHSVATHSELGNNTLDFLFHRQNGFVEMKYTFYNGTRIDFYIKEIQNRQK